MYKIIGKNFLHAWARVIFHFDALKLSKVDNY